MLPLLAAGMTFTVTVPEAEAADRCALGGGWTPLGQVAPAVPGITDFELVRFADLDGDGDDDRLLLDEIGGVREWRNDRDGRWSYRGRTAMGTGYPPERVRFAETGRRLAGPCSGQRVRRRSGPGPQPTGSEDRRKWPGG